ncbi:hypothetical protein CGCSCA1_v015094 [Colletotrichum siamense]|nr:hypothetical protein CGCSCA1_v015094 [Colletotrichum siamense]
MAVNILVASMTLIGSSPSFLTTLGALIFIGLHRTQRRSLRHVLIINLMVAAAGMGVMEPVSGNWCWITRDRPDLRFALAHVWRLWIMFTTVCIYAFVWRYLSQHLRATASTSWLSCDAESSTVRMTTALTHQSSNKPSHHFSKMRLTGVLAFCATVYGMAISNVPNGTENEISIPQDDNTAATHEDHFSASGIFSRDQSKAWREAEKVVGRPLQNNKCYYFMSCNPAYRNHRHTREPYPKYVVDWTDCVHVGLDVGKTARFQKKFEAEYLHVRVQDSKPGEWTQTRHKWDGPVIDRRNTYKGQKASVNITKLWNYGWYLPDFPRATDA